MTPTGRSVEELARRSEDGVREHLAAGRLVEGLQHMSPEYLKGIRRILTVSADTELVSAPSYLRAAQHAPALNNFGSAVSIIQDELAHAHIGYRLLGDEDRRKLVHVRFEGLRARVDDPAAVGVAEPGPVPECRLRRSDRAVGVLRRGVGDAPDQLASARVRDLPLLAGQGFSRPADERAVLDQGLNAHRVSSPSA